jgi:hypothetical protein
MFLTDMQSVDQLLGLSEMDQHRWFEGKENLTGKTFDLPASAADLTTLARSLSNLTLGVGEAWVQITYWQNDFEANQDLFYGYRKGHGDTRSLEEAAIYQFAPEDAAPLCSILSMVLLFSWDARLFDMDRTYFFGITHDKALNFDTCSAAFEESADALFYYAKLRRWPSEAAR